MPRYLLSVYGPTERTDFGNYPSKGATLQAFADTGAFNEKLQREGHFVFADGLEPAAEGSKACRGKVEVRPFHTEESVQALLEP